VAAANLDVRPAIASGIVAPNATNLVLLFSLDSIPVSKQRLVCRWHRNAAGSSAPGSQTYPPIPHPRSERTCRNGS
jgi:hypothetical protein